MVICHDRSCNGRGSFFRAVGSGVIERAEGNGVKIGKTGELRSRKEAFGFLVESGRESGNWRVASGISFDAINADFVSLIQSGSLEVAKPRQTEVIPVN